jgi:hypothetical protein
LTPHRAPDEATGQLAIAWLIRSCHFAVISYQTNLTYSCVSKTNSRSE